MRALRNEHMEKRPLSGKPQAGNERPHHGRSGQSRRIPQILIATGWPDYRVGHVAVVEDGLEDRRSFARFNRESNVGIGVMRPPAPTSWPCATRSRSAYPTAQAAAADMEIGISTDYSLFIKDDIEEVKQSLMFGIALTAWSRLSFSAPLARR